MEPARPPESSALGGLTVGSAHGGSGGSGGGLYGIATVENVVEEATSVPWLFSAMPLPHPLGGLDLPWSADGAALLDDEDRVVDLTQSEEYGAGSPQSATGGGNDVGDQHDADTAVVGQRRLVGDSGPDTDELSVTRKSTRRGGSGGSISSINPHDVSGEEGHRERHSERGDLSTPTARSAMEVDAAPVAVASDGLATAPPALPPNAETGESSSANDAGTAAEVETEANVSLRFVCHVEMARLLTSVAMNVLAEDGIGEEECNRILQAAEDFFAAFGRSYSG